MSEEYENRHPEVLPDGDYKRKMKGKVLEEQIRTRVGEDGVEETHVNYEPVNGRALKYFSFRDGYDQIDWSDDGTNERTNEETNNRNDEETNQRNAEQTQQLRQT